MVRVKGTPNLSDETRLEIAKLTNCGMPLEDIANTYDYSYKTISRISSKKRQILGLENIAITNDQKFIYPQQVYGSDISDKARSLIESLVFEKVISQITYGLHEPTYNHKSFLNHLVNSLERNFPTEKDEEQDIKYLETMKGISMDLLKKNSRKGDFFGSAKEAADYLRKEAISIEANSATLEEKERREEIFQKVENYLKMFELLNISDNVLPHAFNANRRYILESEFGLGREKKTRYDLADELNIPTYIFPKYIQKSCDIIRHKLINQGYKIN
jgi:hypothetical protein